MAKVIVFYINFSHYAYSRDLFKTVYTQEIISCLLRQMKEAVGLIIFKSFYPQV